MPIREYHRGVVVTIDATPSWWSDGRRTKYAALANYFGGRSMLGRDPDYARHGFQWATDVKLGIDKVEVTALLPMGVDFGGDIDQMREHLEAMRGEFVEPATESV